MKKLFAKIVFTATILAPLAFAMPAQGSLVPSWDVSGNWLFNFALTGGSFDTNLYDVSFNQTGEAITGLGQYPNPGPYAYAWDLTGSVIGNNISFTATYNLGAPGTIMHVNGTIAADGTMGGNWDDNFSGGRTGTWVTRGGSANMSGVTGWGTELSASSCVGKTGSPLVNINEKVTGDVDSGLGGNWAIDSYIRHIQVWRTGSKTSDIYCALVTYEGTANAVAGRTGPGGFGTISEGVTAQMKGGYRATFTGVFNPTGEWQSKGSVGAVDYGCDIDGNNCNYVDWVEKYFSVYENFQQPWWGWFYYAGDHGSWLNSVDANLGNIQ